MSRGPYREPSGEAPRAERPAFWTKNLRGTLALLAVVAFGSLMTSLASGAWVASNSDLRSVQCGGLTESPDGLELSLEGCVVDLGQTVVEQRGSMIVAAYAPVVAEPGGPAYVIIRQKGYNEPLVRWARSGSDTPPDALVRWATESPRRVRRVSPLFGPKTSPRSHMDNIGFGSVLVEDGSGVWDWWIFPLFFLAFAGLCVVGGLLSLRTRRRTLKQLEKRDQVLEVWQQHMREGRAKAERGQLEEATRVYVDTLDIARQLGGPQGVHVARTLMALAETQALRGQLERAIETIQRAGSMLVAQPRPYDDHVEELLELAREIRDDLDSWDAQEGPAG